MGAVKLAVIAVALAVFAVVQVWAWVMPGGH